MNEQATKRAIDAALKDFAEQPLGHATSRLCEVLGYTSKKRITLSPNNLSTFLATFADGKTLNERYALPDEWNAVDFVFQLTDEEIRAATGQHGQRVLFGSDGVYNGAVINSYLIFAINLKGSHYTRTALAGITRELNKLFAMPALVFFRHGETLTLAVINRRLHKRDTAKDVLEKVTLIKDIRFADTHRAHIEILFDLSLAALYERHALANFVDLHAAWQKTLDISALNKRFYEELANWYFWALDHVRFPEQAPKDADGQDSVSLIRLITRVMFCWFLKEKGLLPYSLFDPRKTPALLNDVAPNASTYYKAILQNLFFATLNQEMDKRGFRKNGQHFMAHNLYRYRNLLKNPDEALHLFASIPFMNGGLFECLDKVLGTKDKPNHIRIDGFSDRDDNAIKVPNELFFGDEREVDLSEAYGDVRYASAKVRGLIHTLNRYKFTVVENTPIEEEIALDPELLGKVFENLLAAYNPETEATARKQTGSYYTPREIVNYMVDESLITSLKTKFKASCPNAANVEERLRHLFAYNDLPHQFTSSEVGALIEAIDHLTILDPACGSGAFPMGVLHKLVFVLNKLDPGNEHWKARQITKAQEILDPIVRESTLASIEQAFTDNELDYGRKLYLIENGIYGVDIQPIAVQISKLRFFISLLVEQNVNPRADNLGIRPLPNLETKFVAANSLIGLARPGQQLLRNQAIDAKEAELRHVRERHFLARTPTTKAKCRELDVKLRVEIAELLKTDGWDVTTAHKLAAWDPYDQNASAGFFDPEWMFGLTSGFDVVIGNPPYLNVELVAANQKIYYAAHYKTFYKRFDVFGLFFERSLCQFVNKGIVAFIIPSQIFNNLSYKKLRHLMLANRWLSEVLYLGDKIFAAANNDVCVLFLNTAGVSAIRLVNALDFANPSITEVPPAYFEKYGGILSISSSAGADGIATKMFRPGAVRVRDQFDVFQGIVTGNNQVFLPEPEQIATEKIEKKLLHSVVHGRDIEKWRVHNTSRQILYVDGDTEIKKFPNAEKWLAYHRSELKTRRECVNGVIPWYSLQWPRNKASLDAVPKIIVQATRNPRLKTRIVAAFDETGCYGTQGVNFIVPKTKGFSPKALLAILNSSLVNWLFRTRFLNVAIKAEYLKDLPLPLLSEKDIRALSGVVNQILDAKRREPDADTHMLEMNLDRQVYTLYGLLPEEIDLVDKSAAAAGAVPEPN